MQLRDSNETEKGDNSEGTNTGAESNEAKRTEDTEQAGNETPTAVESKEERAEEIDPEKLKGLSRKERRALMFKNRVCLGNLSSYSKFCDAYAYLFS